MRPSPTKKLPATRDAARHPLTEAYISLCAEGVEKADALLSLIGPLLQRHEIASTSFEWDMDDYVQQRIEQAKHQRTQNALNIRNNTLEALMNIVNQDVRSFFTQETVTAPDPNDPEQALTQLRTRPKPIHEWSKAQAQAVKTIRFQTTTDPFGNTTDTTRIEFHDLVKAAKTLSDLAPNEMLTNQRTKDDAVTYDALVNLTEDELHTLHDQLLKSA